ncbi:MAG: Snf7 family protein [Candidatus Nezhaarchaeota archaeon]|nr:Snf7 family protein [Candidatus Nezhaarchaeota archaeon]MCX8141438.1 Snf7 family protein [Candidatus Nezhaarchaeota archaeon]MDW8049704.1 Snf7 family protein [Nitrososphaerota archaeon]
MSKIERFAKKWDKQLKEPVSTKLRSLIIPDAPLKHKIELAMNKLKLQLNKLDQVSARLMERDKKIFEKVVEAFMKHEMDRATLYANELAELRKMNRIILYSKLSLEKVLLRLGTIREVGELVVAMAPAVYVIRNIQSSLAGVLPEAEHELSELGELLNSVVLEAGQVTGQAVTLEASEEAQKILEEAMAIAEQKMREKLPEIPTSTTPLPDKQKTTEVR